MVKRVGDEIIMKIDNLNMEELKNIEFTYDNLDLLKVIKYFVGVVVNDIEFMNNLVDEQDEYDLGNNYKIKNDDLESLVSIMETIDNIIDDNK